MEDFHGDVDVLIGAVGPVGLNGTNRVHHFEAFDDPSKDGVLHVEVGRSAQFLVSRNLVRGVAVRLQHAAPLAVDHVLERLRAHIAPLDDVELASTAAALWIDLISLTGRSQGPFDMDEGRVDLRLDGVARSSSTQARSGGGVHGLGISPLRHEPRNDPVEQRSVVEPFSSQLQKVVAVLGGLIVQLHHDDPQGSRHLHPGTGRIVLGRDSGQDKPKARAAMRAERSVETTIGRNLRYLYACRRRPTLRRRSDLENMKSKTPFRALLSLTAVAVFALGFSGCTEIEDTVAVVYVQNNLGAPVQGAEVRLFAVGSVDQTFIGELRFDTTQVTNAAGSVSFNFSEYYKQGQAGFAVLDIEATKGSLTGIGIIKIEEEMTNEQTVIME